MIAPSVSAVNCSAPGRFTDASRLPTWRVFTFTPGSDATTMPMPTATSAAGIFPAGPGTFFHTKLSTIVTMPSRVAIIACGFVRMPASSPGIPAMFSIAVPGALASAIG